MVYCYNDAAYPCSVDAVGDCILEKISWDFYEIGSFVGWRNWCENDANLVAYGKSNVENTRYQERKRSSGGIIV